MGDNARMRLLTFLTVLTVLAGLLFLWPGDPVATPPILDTSKSPVVAGPTTRRSWAVPVDRPGLPNLHRVSPVLYRGAQPLSDGYAQLKDLGINLVLSLRSFHGESDEVHAAGLDYERLTVKAWHLEDKEIDRFLSLVTDERKTPVFVHCQHGADRTGTMCAIYRIVVQGWTREEALEEMRQGDFGFHEIWDNLVRDIRSLDVDAWRAKYAPR